MCSVMVALYDNSAVAAGFVQTVDNFRTNGAFVFAMSVAASQVSPAS